MSSAQPLPPKLHLEFAGQGQPVLDELRRAARATAAAGSLCRACGAALELLVPLAPPHIFPAEGFPLARWLAEGAEGARKAEDGEDVLRAPVSFVLITLLQLCHYAAFAEQHGGQASVVGRTASAFGHSQGIGGGGKGNAREARRERKAKRRHTAPLCYFCSTMTDGKKGARARIFMTQGSRQCGA